MMTIRRKNNNNTINNLLANCCSKLLVKCDNPENKHQLVHGLKTGLSVQSIFYSKQNQQTTLCRTVKRS